MHTKNTKNITMAFMTFREKELKSYCIDAFTIKDLHLEKFDGKGLRVLEDMAMDMGSKCKYDKPRFDDLKQQVIQNIYALTTDEEERSNLFAYVNCVMGKAKKYSML